MVTIFDNLNVFLNYAVQLLVNIIGCLRKLPNIISDAHLLMERYQSIFPDFIWFLILFAFGTGIICKMLHWG